MSTLFLENASYKKFEKTTFEEAYLSLIELVQFNESRMEALFTADFRLHLNESTLTEEEVAKEKKGIISRVVQGIKDFVAKLVAAIKKFLGLGGADSADKKVKNTDDDFETPIVAPDGWATKVIDLFTVLSKKMTNVVLKLVSRRITKEELSKELEEVTALDSAITDLKEKSNSKSKLKMKQVSAIWSKAHIFKQVAENDVKSIEKVSEMVADDKTATPESLSLINYGLGVVRNLFSIGMKYYLMLVNTINKITGNEAK